LPKEATDVSWRVLSWGTILYGAVLSGLAAALLAFSYLRSRRFDRLAAAALSGAAGPFVWNAILHRIEGREFFVDAPVALMPASWQDTGSGVFAVAAATVILGLGPVRNEPARGVAVLALLCGLGSFLVDVYLY